MKSLMLAFFVLSLPSWGAAVSESHGQLGVESTTFFGRLSENPEAGSYSSLVLDYRGRATLRNWGEAVVDAGGFFFFDAYDPLINPRELYLASREIRQWETSKLTLGRKLERWSEVDQQWQLGLWQPRFRWDYLHPQPQGLTGVFVEVFERGAFRVVAFASPISIPDQGADVKSENGQIISRSPWSSKPISSVEFGGQQTPVIYSITRPDTSSVIQHPAGSLMLELGDTQRGLWFRGAYAYKPINQLALSADGNLSSRQLPGAGQANQNQFNVNVTPHVVYHSLFEGTVGVETQSIGTWISVVKDRPEEISYAEDVVIGQSYDSTFIVSPGVRWRFGDGRKNQSTRLESSTKTRTNSSDSGELSASWLRRWGGDAPPKGPFAGSTQNTFEPRFLYENALKLALDLPLINGRLGRLAFGGQSIYEAVGEGLIISSLFSLQTRKSWSVLLGADLIGQARPVDDSGDATMMSRYPQNNSIYAGVSYVF